MIVSLDFEMLWGILDHKNPMDYELNIKNVPKVVRLLLKLFDKYGIHATWGCVGMLMQNNLQRVEDETLQAVPLYEDLSLSAYAHFDFLKFVKSEYLFAPDLVRIIQSTDGQELGSHTYSHFYCNEKGSSGNQLEEDLRKSVEVIQRFGVTPVSIIFPRNQINEVYKETVLNCGFYNYRGTEDIWFYRTPDTRVGNSILRRGLRLADNYIPISGSCCYRWQDIRQECGMNNIKSSRFFRPYSRGFAVFEPLRIKRIMGQMKYAAKHNMVFHIWWHPHNFGSNMEQNFKNLLKLIKYYEKLRNIYGFQSLNMGEAGGCLCEDYGFRG